MKTKDDTGEALSIVPGPEKGRELQNHCPSFMPSVFLSTHEMAGAVLNARENDPVLRHLLVEDADKQMSL